MTDFEPGRWSGGLDLPAAGVHRITFGIGWTPDQLLTSIDDTAVDRYWSTAPDPLLTAGTVLPYGDGALLDLHFGSTVTPRTIRTVLGDLVPEVPALVVPRIEVPGFELLAFDDTSPGIVNVAPRARPRCVRCKLRHRAEEPCPT
jgi:hypothetical protein